MGCGIVAVQIRHAEETDSSIAMEHGRNGMRVFEATEESHRTGREVILDW